MTAMPQKIIALPVPTHTPSMNDYETPPAAWVVLPHLTIPSTVSFNTHANPVLEHLAAQVKGITSINDIADIMRPNLVEDKNPLEVVRGAFLEYLLK